MLQQLINNNIGIFIFKTWEQFKYNVYFSVFSVMMKIHDGLLISYDDSHQFLTTDMHIGFLLFMQNFNQNFSKCYDCKCFQD